MKKSEVQKLEKINQELKRLNRTKTQFISIASHQLRTPLAAVKGYLSMIMDGDYGSVAPNQKKILETVLQSANRLVRLVDTLLDVSRIESGRLDIVFRRTQLINVLENKIRELQSEAELKEQAISFKKPPGQVPEILADSSKLDEVFGNILDNAVKYTPVKGKININLEVNREDILITIQDTGIGIPKDEIPYLFDRFARGRGVKVNPAGSGLGLYIVRKLVEGHGGKVWVESAGLDKGSTFFVKLPRKAKGIKENSTVTLKAEDPPAPTH
jgi:signal transduction histidine kinase